MDRAALNCGRTGGAVKLKLDLHDIYNRGEPIDRALQSIIDQAVAKKAPLVEIILGKGSGQLKACPSVPRPQGHQGSLPPRREGLRQLRPDLRPLPLEVTYIRSCRASRRSAWSTAHSRVRRWIWPARFDRKHRLTYSSERRAMLVGVRPSSQAPVMAATGSPRIRTARSA